MITSEFVVARSSNHGTQWTGVIMVSAHGAEYDWWTCSHAHQDSVKAHECASAEMDRRYESRQRYYSEHEAAILASEDRAECLARELY